MQVGDLFSQSNLLLSLPPLQLKQYAGHQLFGFLVWWEQQLAIVTMNIVFFQGWRLVVVMFLSVCWCIAKKIQNAAMFSHYSATTFWHAIPTFVIHFLLEGERWSGLWYLIEGVSIAGKASRKFEGATLRKFAYHTYSFLTFWHT